MRVVFFIALILLTATFSAAAPSEFKGLCTTTGDGIDTPVKFFLTIGNTTYALEGLTFYPYKDTQLTVIGEIVATDRIIVQRAFYPFELKPILGKKKAAVLISQFEGDLYPNPTEVIAAFSQVFSKSTSPSMTSYFEEISYGQISIDFEIIGIFTVPEDKESSCPIESDLVKEAAAAAGIDLSLYDFTLSFFQPRPGCNSTAYGETRGKSSIFGFSYKDFDKNGNLAAIHHELLHNLGVGHGNSLECSTGDNAYTIYSGNCFLSEHGDPFSVQGTLFGPSHPSSAEKYYLGWLPDSAIKYVSKSGIYEVAAVETTSVLPRVLRIQRGDFPVPGKNSDHAPFQQYDYWISLNQPSSAQESERVKDSSYYDKAVIRLIGNYPKTPSGSVFAGPVYDDSVYIVIPAPEGGIYEGLPSGLNFTDSEKGISITSLGMKKASENILKIKICFDGEICPKGDQSPILKTNGKVLKFRTGQKQTKPLGPKVKGKITNCTSSPKLPKGLILDKKTCKITGQPVKAAAYKTYTFTASGKTGYGRGEVSLEVKKN